jgi:hypothetical protein
MNAHLDEFLARMRVGDLAKRCHANASEAQISDALRRFDLLRVDIEDEAPPVVSMRRLQ